MTVLLTDSQFNSLALVVIALIGIIPASIAAYNSREAKKNSAEAKQSAAEAANEVKTNGGMTDPNPNLNDHVKYQTEMAEKLLQVALPLVEKVEDIDTRFTDHLEYTAQASQKLEHIEGKLDEHLKHSQIMDRALAEVYLEVKPDVTLEEDDT